MMDNNEDASGDASTTPYGSTFDMDNLKILAYALNTPPGGLLSFLKGKLGGSFERATNFKLLVANSIEYAQEQEQEQEQELEQELEQEQEGAAVESSRRRVQSSIQGRQTKPPPSILDKNKLIMIRDAVEEIKKEQVKAMKQ